MCRHRGLLSLFITESVHGISLGLNKKSPLQTRHVLQKDVFKDPVLLSHQKHDWRTAPYKYFFWYDTDTLSVKGADYKSIVGVVSEEGSFFCYYNKNILKDTFFWLV